VNTCYVLYSESDVRKKWDAFGSRVVQLSELSSQIKTSPPFQFIEVIRVRFSAFYINGIVCLSFNTVLH